MPEPISLIIHDQFKFLILAENETNSIISLHGRKLRLLLLYEINLIWFFIGSFAWNLSCIHFSHESFHATRFLVLASRTISELSMTLCYFIWSLMWTQELRSADPRCTHFLVVHCLSSSVLHIGEIFEITSKVPARHHLDAARSDFSRVVARNEIIALLSVRVQTTLVLQIRSLHLSSIRSLVMLV